MENFYQIYYKKFLISKKHSFLKNNREKIRTLPMKTKKLYKNHPNYSIILSLTAQAA